MKSMTTSSDASTPSGIPMTPTRNETRRDASRPRSRCAKSAAASDSSVATRSRISSMTTWPRLNCETSCEWFVRSVTGASSWSVCRRDRRWFTNTRSCAISANCCAVVTDRDPSASACRGGALRSRACTARGTTLSGQDVAPRPRLRVREVDQDPVRARCEAPTALPFVPRARSSFAVVPEQGTGRDPSTITGIAMTARILDRSDTEPPKAVAFCIDGAETPLTPGKLGCLPTGRYRIICRMVENAVDAAGFRDRRSPHGQDDPADRASPGSWGRSSSSGCSATCPRAGSSCLVRSQTGSTSRDRVEYLFRKPAFDVVRGRIGEDGLRALLDERVTIVDGDFSRGCAGASGRHRHRDPLRRDGRRSIRRSTRGSRRTCSAR